MSTGNDGFTDCTYVCNPENDMARSCNDYCPDYVFITTTQRTITTPSPNPYMIHTNKSEDLLSLVVTLSCGAVLLLAFLLVACCLNKERLKTYLKKCWGKNLQHPLNVQTTTNDEEAEKARHAADEDAVAMLSVENENGRKTEGANDSNQSSFNQIKRPVNLPINYNLSSSPTIGNDSASVKAQIPTVKRYEHQLDTFTGERNHYSEDETELKEVGERADLAIDQIPSLPFVSKVIPLEYTNDADKVTMTVSKEHSYQNERNFNVDRADFMYSETDLTRNGTNDSTVSSDTNEYISIDIDNKINEVTANAGGDVETVDDHDNNTSINDSDDNDSTDDDSTGDDDDDDNNDDDDDDEEEEEDNSTRVTEGEHLLQNVGRANPVSNKTENTLSNKNGRMVRVTTETNFREM